MMDLSLATAAIAVIPYTPYNKTKKRFFIGVSRKNDPTDYGFPGGKIEAGESALSAMLREVKEEVGANLLCPKANIQLLHCGPDESGVIVAAYLIDLNVPDDEVEERFSFIEKNPPKNEGIVCIVSRGLLMLKSFATYNRKIFQLLDQND